MNNDPINTLMTSISFNCLRCATPHCSKLKMNGKKLSKFQFHFPGLLGTSLMSKQETKKILGPVHLLPKRDKWDFLRSPVIDFWFCFMFDKFLENLGSRFGTCSVFCHSFLLSNNVTPLLYVFKACVGFRSFYFYNMY